jgi:hypothetical protein
LLDPKLFRRLAGFNASFECLGSSKTFKRDIETREASEWGNRCLGNFHTVPWVLVSVNIELVASGLEARFDGSFISFHDFIKLLKS